MATVTKSIGTSSRDYSTIALWEADLDNGAVYSASDDAVGECYNDSDFAGATINGGNIIGLSSTLLQPASGEEHNGTAGTGVRVTGNIDFRPNVAGTIRLLELDGNVGIINLLNALLGIVERNLIHNKTGSGAGIEIRAGNKYIHNNIIYGFVNSGTGSSSAYGIHINAIPTSAVVIRNNTIHNITRNTSATASSYGIFLVDDADVIIQNNLITQIDGTSGGSHDSYSDSSPSLATVDHNAAGDTTASGTGSINSITPSNQYVSVVEGSEDLHIKTGSDAIGAGADSGTTNGVNIDIDGSDRDTLGIVWDIGAHEFLIGATEESLGAAITFPILVGNTNNTLYRQWYTPPV